MYGILSDISNTISLPLLNLVGSLAEYPLFIALVLGLIGAVAPCQLTANVSAVTIYGNKTMQSKTDWTEVFCFVFGKVLVFSLLGLFVWMLGNEFEQNITTFFSTFRNFVGPMIIFIGLFLLGVFKLHFINRLTSWIPLKIGQGKFGSFMMGVTFSIAFCPTMFVLFFVTLMPIVLSSPFGFALPSLFGIATSIPVLIILLMMRFLELDGSMLKNSKRFGAIIQKAAGSVLVLVGVLDTITYWGL
ncbi:hypothetical protein KP78_07200 [Jeotgalibacillus soli]|uniref:Urease accessory protein UreH-like transmembrane domain-containing protein n=2 Tax=Jeotgalibacillus soli TaxID=889306 RepID=A0A0C2VK28_9BACL|nr:hypothetical protein KP78_07200 [Jeotgalibacillus soli]